MTYISLSLPRLCLSVEKIELWKIWIQNYVVLCLLFDYQFFYLRLSFSGNYDNYPSLIRQNALNNNLENPRLPPYPHATQTYPMAQIKQPLILATGLGSKSQSPTHTSPGGKDNVLVVNACFSTPRLWIGGNPNVSVEHRGKSEKCILIK